MQNQAQKISQKIAEIKPPKSLKKAVFKRLEAEKDKQIKTKMFLTNFGLAASGLLFFGLVILRERGIGLIVYEIFKINRL